MFTTMKKAYIEPKCKLLALSEEENLMESSVITGGGNGQSGDVGESREVIRTESAWDNEW